MSRLFPTQSEREALDDEREQKALAKQLEREARYYSRMIPEWLADIGIDHWLRKESRPTLAESVITGKRSRQRIRFIEARYNSAAIYLRVDTRNLPYQTLLSHLRDPEALETLSAACERQVAFKAFPQIPPQNGAWIVIYREGSIGAIPGKFAFKDAIQNMPKGATPLRYCAGVAENMALIMPDIAHMPHLLIAGSTGMGKSVHLNSILAQLLWRNGPETVQFVMIDLKGGMELQDYANIPHLVGHKIVTEIKDVEPALVSFKNEMERRQRMFAGRCRDLIGWNQLNSKNQLPYLVLVIDELAQILKNPDQTLSNQVEIVLGGVLSVSRATGGHAILCTQRPSVDVVTGYIKTNVSSRVAFGVPTQSDSRVILDSSHASELTLPGRAIFLNGAKRVEMQTPNITPTLIRRIVKKVCDRPAPPDRLVPLTIDEIVKYSLDNLGGSLRTKSIVAAFNDRASHRAIEEMLQLMDGQMIEIDDQVFAVRDGRGSASRRVEPATDDDFEIA